MLSRIVAVFAIVSFALASVLPPRQVATVTVPAALASPTTITTTETVQSTNGTMVETCVFTFTPDGSQVVEVKNCTTASSPTSTVAAAFVMPGTSIQVLPVGLGVYGGITAIGIAFVVFVTWERVQCRKGFRRQRMVENNKGM